MQLKTKKREKENNYYCQFKQDKIRLIFKTYRMDGASSLSFCQSLSNSSYHGSTTPTSIFREFNQYGVTGSQLINGSFHPENSSEEQLT